jgi:ABC-type molybdenum transport system ATPase subunit/photorepair protein PhrA
MALSNQKINYISIKKLKNISNLEALPLNEKHLTAILGVNGCGKSTILHALACCYKPTQNSNATNHIFSHWFTPTTDATWMGSELTLNHEWKDGKNDFCEDQIFTKQVNRWTPRYDRRTERHVELIGITTCVPKIEQESQISFIKYETNAVVTEVSDRVRSAMGEILGRNYTELNQHKVSKTKNYYGLEHTGVRYSALSMGAGEQRLLFILQKVFEAPKYSLILIDEIDLLLHTNALHLLIQQLHKRAVEKSLQVIFTTHRESVLELSEILSIKHIHQSENKTHWLTDTKSETLLRLTGKAEKVIELFVEDDVSLAIAMQVAGSLGLRKYVSVKIFGAAQNSFAIASSFVVRKENLNNIALILDGDVYVSDEEKKEMMNKALTGEGEKFNLMREKALSLIFQYHSEEKHSPELVLLDMILKLNSNELSDEQLEVFNAVKNSAYAVNHHDVLKKTRDLLGYETNECNREVVKLASLSPNWNQYVNALELWLKSKKENLVETF